MATAGLVAVDAVLVVQLLAVVLRLGVVDGSAGEELRGVGVRVVGYGGGLGLGLVDTIHVGPAFS